MHSKVEPKFEFQSGGKSDCPCCGGSEFAWGFCNPGGHGLTFKSGEDNWWVRNTILGGDEIKARACRTCGNIQFFIRAGAPGLAEPGQPQC